MKLKKILGITGVAIASVALLTACSSKSPKEASKSSGAKETINFATVGITAPVSYTHLDVYKRQTTYHA